MMTGQKPTAKTALISLTVTPLPQQNEKQQILLESAKTELGCNSMETCKIFCQQNLEKCAEFARKFYANQTNTKTQRCLPRPPCLDAIPACKIPEPVGGWCTKENTTYPQTTMSPSAAYACPTSKWIDCMPKLGIPITPTTMDKQICSNDYLSWAKINCPGFEGAAY